jgi:hypothetical protein
MPPRRAAHFRGLPLTLASTAESVEARVKRLRPQDHVNDSPPAVAACVGTSPWEVASSAAGVQAGSTEGVRADAPIVRNVRRGSFLMAADSLATNGAGTLIDELVRDRHARSSTASINSWLSTWSRFHRLAFGDCVPPVPLYPVTPCTLVHIASLFKSGGYRGFPNYLSAAKSAHIEAGFAWDALLSHTGSWVSRSVLRGIGPARQSCCFDYARLCGLPRAHVPLVDKGPHSPIHLVLLACLFLLREVEVSNSMRSSWKLSAEDQVLTWHLPASKSDHLALGANRSWGCLCDVPGFACPYHLAHEHLAWLMASGLALGSDGPLFPTIDGCVASKVAVVATFEAVGILLGQPLISDTGIRLFGGHSPRVTGAQVLTASGIEVSKVRILARHSGDAILRYVADAPLLSLRSDLGAAVTRASLLSGADARTTSAVNARVRKLEKALRSLQHDVQGQAQDVVALATGFARTDNRVYVQNTTTATVHMALTIDAGHAACGWRFSTARRTPNGLPYRVVQSLVDLPGSMLCERCLPTERAIAVSAANSFEVDLSGDES